MVAAEVAAVPFDHLAAGTSENYWEQSSTLRTGGDLELAAVQRLIVLAAHPDDETLGAGGLITVAAATGISVVLVIATLGEQSHPRSTTHDPERLRAIRRAEVTAAVSILDPTAVVRILELPDGELSAHEDELSSVVAEFVDPAGTLVAAPWEGDRHPDHAAAARAARAAVIGENAVLLQYPIWLWHWGSAADLPAKLVRLQLSSATLEAKHAALQCYRSQIAPLSDLPGDEPIIGSQFAEHFERGYEIFVAPEVVSPKSADRVSDSRSLGEDFFDDFYGDQSDPWGFESRWYETRKRAITLASLPRQFFGSGFEPGCSIGVLTAELAARCDRLLATDISERPLTLARRRLDGVSGVRFERRRIPQDWPAEQFDLVVLSEVGYYCGPDDLRTLVDLASSSLTADGVLLACHWRHPVGEYPLGGDDVHRALCDAPGLAVLAEHVEEDFLLHVFTRPGVGSVARSTGLVP